MSNPLYSLVPNQSCNAAAGTAPTVPTSSTPLAQSPGAGNPSPAAATSAPGAAAAAAAAASAASSYVNLSTVLNQKDSRWLQLEVCREFQRNKCTRPDFECKFAHPGPSIEVQSGKVTACYDSIKGRCNRDKPPCKYFHPPQHLKDQLLINGRNHLALKNAIMQHVGLTAPTIIPNQPPSMVLGPSIPPMYTLPIGYLGNHAGIPFGYSCDQYATMGLVNDATFGGAAGAAAAAAALRASALANQRQVQAQVQAAALAQQSVSSVWNGHPVRSRSDRVEVCREFRRGFCTRSVNECRFAHPMEGVNISEDGSVTICMDHEKGRCARDPCRYFHRPEHMKASSAKSAAPAAAGTHFMTNQGPPVQPGHPIYVAAAAGGISDPQRTSAAAAAAAGVNASLLV